MKEIIHTFLLIVLPFLWLGVPIISTIAVNKMRYLYDDKTDKAGFELKRRSWGPSYKDAKRIMHSTKDENTKQKAKETIRLWNFSFYCLYSAIISIIIIWILNP